MLRRRVEDVIHGGRRKGYHVVVLAVLMVLLSLMKESEARASRVAPLLAVKVCHLLGEEMVLRNRSVVDRGWHAWMEAGREEESRLIIAVLQLGRMLRLRERLVRNNLYFVPWPLKSPLEEHRQSVQVEIH